MAGEVIKLDEPDADELTGAYEASIRYARRRAPWPDTLTEKAIDAGTDGVLWARANYFAKRGTFAAFAAAAVKRFVTSCLRHEASKFRNQPTRQGLHEGIPARQISDNGAEVPLPLAVRDLPADLRDVVRFFYVDRFDIRECSLLLGIHRETVRARLKEAAARLAEDLPEQQRPKRAGEKRMTH